MGKTHKYKYNWTHLRRENENASVPPLFLYLMRKNLYSVVMTQPKLGKILSALGLNKARTVLFMGCPYTPKPINV